MPDTQQALEFNICSAGFSLVFVQFCFGLTPTVYVPIPLLFGMELFSFIYRNLFF
jgi:hypothetical protein